MNFELLAPILGNTVINLFYSLKSCLGNTFFWLLYSRLFQYYSYIYTIFSSLNVHFKDGVASSAENQHSQSTKNYATNCKFIPFNAANQKCQNQ